ncbi:amidohydrolase family protein, partial [Oceanobacillus massiliensis]
PLHFVHISSAQSVQIITKAKQQGMDVTLETCPHYLLCTMSDLETKGAAAKCAPPLRDERENRRLIESLLEDKIDMITSDHSPCPPELKDPANFSLRKAWGGINGGQFTLLSMIELAIKHDIPFERIAKWTASNPAKRFHLADKGEIRVGMDADLAIISLDQAHTVTAENLFSRHKQSLYMDHTFPCRIIGTINRGTPIYQADKDTKNTGKGKWLRG